MRMGRWMCVVLLTDRPGGVQILKEDLRSRMGLECIWEMMRMGRLRWFGHVERMDEESGLKMVSDVNVDGRVSKSRPKRM